MYRYRPNEASPSSLSSSTGTVFGSQRTLHEAQTGQPSSIPRPSSHTPSRSVSQPQSTTGVAAAMSPRPQLQLFVFLTAVFLSRNKLAQIQVDQCGDDAFFYALRIEYFGMKGILWRLLSVWQFSHCMFRMVTSDQTHSLDIRPMEK